MSTVSKERELSLTIKLNKMLPPDRQCRDFIEQCERKLDAIRNPRRNSKLRVVDKPKRAAS
jgi:hypothetical protein